MKKWLLGLLAIFLLLVGGTYFFIPAKLPISRDVTIVANQQAVFRFLSNKNNWVKWWPGEDSAISNLKDALTYGDYQFAIKKVLHNAFEITVSRDETNTTSLLQIFSYAIDSINIKWSTEFTAGNSPVTKIQHYLAARQMGIYFEKILHELGKHASSLKNIYGVEIKKEKVQVQLLISTKKSFPTYPRMEEIYDMVDKLKDYRHKFNAKGDSFPMLSIQKLDDAGYTAQVALPIDTKIPDEKDISTKWMMKGGNILTGEVTGGSSKIDSSMKQMEKYILDYQRTIIAIPFQLLLTDRLQHPDTTKWLTRLYYPVI